MMQHPLEVCNYLHLTDAGAHCVRLLVRICPAASPGANIWVYKSRKLWYTGPVTNRGALFTLEDFLWTLIPLA